MSREPFIAVASWAPASPADLPGHLRDLLRSPG